MRTDIAIERPSMGIGGGTRAVGGVVGEKETELTIDEKVENLRVLAQLAAEHSMDSDEEIAQFVADRDVFKTFREALRGFGGVSEIASGNSDSPAHASFLAHVITGPKIWISGKRDTPAGLADYEYEFSLEETGTLHAFLNRGEREYVNRGGRRILGETEVGWIVMSESAAELASVIEIHEKRLGIVREAIGVAAANSINEISNRALSYGS